MCGTVASLDARHSAMLRELKVVGQTHRAVPSRRWPGLPVTVGAAASHEQEITSWRGSMSQDPSASVIASDAEPGTEPLSWEEVRQRFDAERWYWGATAGRDGRPHIRPVLAVWMNDKVYSTTSPDARKGRNLQARPECSMAARAP